MKKKKVIPELPKTANVFVLGQQAQECQKNQALLEAFDRLEKSYFHTWRTSTPMQVAEREAVFAKQQVLSDVKLALYGMIQDMIAEQEKQKRKENIQ